MTASVSVFDVGVTEKKRTCNRIHEYFLTEHLETYSALSTKRSPRRWIVDMLKLAELWVWKTPEAVQMLLEESLYARGYIPPQEWWPFPRELPQAHFNRVFEMSLVQYLLLLGCCIQYKLALSSVQKSFDDMGCRCRCRCMCMSRGTYAPVTNFLVSVDSSCSLLL